MEVLGLVLATISQGTLHGLLKWNGCGLLKWVWFGHLVNECLLIVYLN